METERAQLKNRNLFISNQLEMKQAPYDKLLPEQKIVIAEYAQALYEKREFIVPERYELKKENEKYKLKIEFLEKQVQNLQTENAFRVYGMQMNRGVGNNNNNQEMPVNFEDFFYIFCFFILFFRRKILRNLWIQCVKIMKS